MTKFYRHKDGGYYQHIYTARSSVDKSSVEVYSHLWPFESGICVRPSIEFWDGRFIEVEWDEITEARDGDQTAAQEAVNRSRNARKGPRVD